MRTIHIKANACFECHRVGMATIDLFSGSGWDPNGHMPPHDPGSLAEDYRELSVAWQRGPEAVEGAEWIIPPARGKDRQVVGDDYPYKAAFNRAAKDEKQASSKTVASKASQEKVARLLKQIPGPPAPGKAFEDWFQENGITEDTLEKLRSMAEGDDSKDDKADDKEGQEPQPKEKQAGHKPK